MLRNLKLWIPKSSESKHFIELILNHPQTDNLGQIIWLLFIFILNMMQKLSEESKGYLLNIKKFKIIKYTT